MMMKVWCRNWSNKYIFAIKGSVWEFARNFWSAHPSPMYLAHEIDVQKIFPVLFNKVEF